jgi:acetoacetyl-CoA synthetase
METPVGDGTLLIVGVELPGGNYYLPLFVVLAEGVTLDDALKAKIKQQLRATVFPHHVPDEISAIQEVPRTLSGKKPEVLIKKLFSSDRRTPIALG